jgi:hypothetical protein
LGTKIVILTPSSASAARVFIRSNFIKFNVDSALVLSGYVFGDYPVAASWSVIFADSPVKVTALTPLAKNFTTSDAAAGITFAFSIGPNTLVAGRTYTFQLTAGNLLHPSASSSFGQIDLAVNAPPGGGSVTVSPSRGTALRTLFSMAMSGWIDDVTDYPLSYGFFYQQYSSYPRLTIADVSQLSYASSMLPSGLTSQDHEILVIGTVEDRFLALSEQTLQVYVKENANLDVTNYLTSSLTKALSSGNIAKGFQAINNIASTINMVNCSAAPNCSAFHRSDCTDMPNTCGSCLAGFLGVAGSANSRCVSASLAPTVVGSSCIADSNCTYGSCSDGPSLSQLCGHVCLLWEWAVYIH